MKKIKKIVSFFLTLTMVALMVTIAIFPASSKQIVPLREGDGVDACPLTVEVTTNKSAYCTLETAVFTVKITNVSSNTVNNISSESSFTDVLPIWSSSVLGVNGKSLPAGESISYSYGATANYTKLNVYMRFFMFIKRLLYCGRSAPVNNFDNGRSCETKDVNIKIGNVDITDTVSVWYEYDAVKNCTVSFNSNGGSAIDDKIVKENSTFVLPTPSKAYTISLETVEGEISTTSCLRDCTFDGWYKDSEFTGTRYEAGSEYTALKNETLYAKWINPTLGNLPIPTRKGSTFLGWYSQIDWGIKYSETSLITQDITLYAQWEIKYVYVPDLTNMTKDQAEKKLVSEGLILGKVRYKNSYIYSEGRVMEQSYSVNSKVEEGTKIDVTISLGPQPTTE